MLPGRAGESSPESTIVAPSKDLGGFRVRRALPKAHEETEPSFQHVGATMLPLIEDTGVSVRLVLGSAFGARSPVPLLSKLFYAAADLDEGARLPLPDDAEERAVYVAEGAVDVAGERIEAAKQDWREQRFAEVPGETEFIPLPDEEQPVRYP